MMELPEESNEKPIETAVEGVEATPLQPKIEEPADEGIPEPIPEVKTADEQAAPVADVAIAIQPETEVPDEAAKVRPKRPKSPTGKRRKNQPTLRQVTARFAGCVRCSYFWAGYRVIHGLAGLETAVANAHAGWLDLQWDAKMPKLILKTYGVRMDIAHFHYEAVCKECRRRFVYDAAENEDGLHEFRIEISPNTAK